jgi:Uncharacterized conserved protein (DUF2190)
MAWASDNTAGDVTFKATADLSAKQYFLVALDTSNEGQMIIANAQTAKAIGVLKDAPTAGDYGRVSLLNRSGFNKARAASAINIGDYLTADSNGRLVTTTTSGDLVIGIAVEAAAAQDDIISFASVNFKY